MAVTEVDVDGVLEHMNADHLEASLSIARAHGYPAALSAEMTGVDEHGATWQVVDAGGAEAMLRVSWPGGPVADTAGVRREVVGLARSARG
ncbi:DUF2470 domain-containing protein [Nocardioides nanhaiensis]|uniref:DUF2470 domain-containing protein n=1 Tax=Nocardioides nanhaiensis TaxID=1476871 RepID=A0ABP8X223_9ACTN